MKKENKTRKLANTLICNIEQVARLGRHSATRFFDTQGNILISFNDFLILEALYDNPNIHQRNLAKILVRDAANLSRELDKLEKRGMIERVIDIKEKRAVKILKLTDDGNKIYLDISNKCVEHIESIENIFTQDEIDDFINNISKLKNRLIEICGNILE